VRELERGQDRFDGRLGRVEEDMKVFRPIPLENAAYRAETTGAIKAMRDDIHEAFEWMRRWENRFEDYVAEQARIREAREEKEREREKAERQRDEDRKAADRRDRYARWIGAEKMTLTFVSMTVGWLILAL
jgi:hypothetical protein